MGDRGSTARQTTLLLVAFVATLVLLAGGWAILGRARPIANPVAPSSGPSALVSPVAGASGLAPSPRSSGGPTVILTGAGDIATCGLAGAAQTSDLLVKQAGTIFTAGDNAYENGSASEFANCYQPTWGRVKDRTMPAAGNHDWNTSGAAGYLAYFGSVAAPDGVTWYSTDLGSWHVIVLDADCGKVGGCEASSPQGRWLADDLAAHATKRCTLAIWHQPRFSSGEHGNDPAVAPFWDQLYAAGAELVINGHDHDYERFAPQDPAGVETRPGGIREIVVGTGGATLRSFHTLAANSEFRLAGTWGVLRLTLHPLNYDWEFLPVSGDITDSGSTPCH